MTTAKKKILAVLAVLGLALGSWLFYLKKQNNKLTVPDNANIKDLKLSLSQAKNNTKVGLELDAISKKMKASAAVPFNQPMWLLNYAEGDFANPNFVPMSNTRSSNRFSAKTFDANKEKILMLWDKRKDEVIRQSEVWKVPNYLILGHMAIENLTGDEKALSNAKSMFTKDTLSGKSIDYNKAVGSLQIKPYTATDSLRTAMKKGILQESQAICLQTLAAGQHLDKALSRTDLGDIIITQELLMNSEFNIAVGCAKLATLMLKYNTQFYKIAADFFQGDYYISNKKLNGFNSYESFRKNVSTEVAEYVDCLCGKYGTLDIIVNHLGITD
jgi:hypothetical protein